MVGRFALGNKSKKSPSRERRDSDATPPPPPYNQEDRDTPVVLAEMTTTTTQVVTTTTHTTTHFFSLPLWRRRTGPVPPNTTSRASLSAPSADEHGMKVPNSPHPLLFEKELPPTPTDADTDEPEAGGVPTIRTGGMSQLISSSPSASQPAKGGNTASASQSTFALAHASLGLGLPHVMPRASCSDINSVAFLSQASPRLDAKLTPSTIRRAKSFQTSPTTSVPEDNMTIMARRRSRGISLTPRDVPLATAEGKAKGKERDSDITSTPIPKPISRKSSFFSRLRKESPRPSVLPLTSITPDGLHPSPVSHPPPRSPPPPSVHQPPGLTRRHSDRSLSRSPPPQVSPSGVDTSLASPVSLTMASPRRRPVRPSTADSTTRSRARSLFLDAFTPSSATSPPPPVPHESRYLDSSRHTHSPQLRNRSQTNPPLLHRLSMNFFSSSGTSTSLTGNTVTSSPSSSTGPSPRPSLSRPSVEIPRPRLDDESPELYLQRVMEAVSKAEVASVLASSPDTFHTQTLRAYIARFDFSGDPLDVALRKLLMDVGLPKETQQIDRVIQAFADRYKECNGNLYASDDHTYILAFSLIMLHTDAFNKSNKRKMTKPDYIKNTRFPGVAPEVLDCFYDNIVFAPFIFIEDPLDVNGQRGLTTDGLASRYTTLGQSPGPANGSTTNLLSRGNKIDPYYLITRNLLDPLKINVDSFLSVENPYSYKGTVDRWDQDRLRRAFAQAGTVEVSSVDHRRLASPFFGISVGGTPTPLLNPIGAYPDLVPPPRDVWKIRMTKVGVLNRKDEVLEGGKKAPNKKWREWGVVLTGSQLLFFRDSSLATNILARAQSSGDHIVLQGDSLLRPDELLSVKDAIAVFDKSYIKHENTMRFVMPEGRQLLLQIPTSAELDEWISCINYASTFKTAGVRMRAMGLSGKDIELTGAAAATSHLRDLQYSRSTPPPPMRTWAVDSLGDSSPHRDILSHASPIERRKDAAYQNGQDSMKAPTAPELESSHQFKATFDEVKAELAAGRFTLPGHQSPLSAGRARAQSTSSIRSPLSDDHSSSRLPSRSQIIRAKVRELDSRLSAAGAQLDADMRFVRNLALLTPFQRATRDRLQVAIQKVAKRIMQVRLECTKLACHRDVLSHDLLAEERDWLEAKTIALKAATDVLQSRQQSLIPRMTLSLHHDESERSPSPQFIPRLSLRPESSIRDSFYSALDFEPESFTLSPSPEPTEGGPSTRSPFFDSGLAGRGGVANGLRRSFSTTNGDRDSKDGESLSPEHKLRRPRLSDAASSIEGEESQGGHDRFSTAPETPEEEAEDWNKTRAAKRVSLVKLPSDLRLSIRLGKPRSPTDTTPTTPRRPSVTHDRRGIPYSMFDA
ncbi:hypothetical protein JAAARDRAFT_29838 [Jaapia argillacea MUCL 33604]|uniref:SEC7 domain-containing protein n=1 Tax=Jaapia argillacea MUCL 33604 TaxID=933084 RepID=A0A067Q9R4_9AGAM|nr:hypothetical protein JAAARDRAFT_29838 [Jaapia argillacea MUCL 33604]